MSAARSSARRSTRSKLIGCGPGRVAISVRSTKRPCSGSSARADVEGARRMTIVSSQRIADPLGDRVGTTRQKVALYANGVPFSTMSHSYKRMLGFFRSLNPMLILIFAAAVTLHDFAWLAGDWQ